MTKTNAVRANSAIFWRAKWGSAHTLTSAMSATYRLICGIPPNNDMAHAAAASVGPVSYTHL
ncbi:MAG: hypothetical protein KIH69_010960, partial [Anaerolineae bacterium]|nr:hypothetical protein [Anaerolineae bacterium]